MRKGKREKGPLFVQTEKLCFAESQENKFGALPGPLWAEVAELGIDPGGPS